MIVTVVESIYVVYEYDDGHIYYVNWSRNDDKYGIVLKGIMKRYKHNYDCHDDLYEFITKKGEQFDRYYYKKLYRILLHKYEERLEAKFYPVYCIAL